MQVTERNSSEQPCIQTDLPLMGKALRFGHQHPWVYDLIKISSIAGTVLAAETALRFVPRNWRWAVGLSAVSCALVYQKLLSPILGILFPQRHDKACRAYPTTTSPVGSLKWSGDVPILSIDMSRPYEAGHFHGTTLSEGLREIRSTIQFALKTLAREDGHECYPKTIEQIIQQLPDEIMEELRGIVDGYNSAIPKGLLVQEPALTVEELILLHLHPDRVHFSPKVSEGLMDPESFHGNERPYGGIACTTIIDGDEETGPIVGRNLDWQTFGITGKWSVLINRVNPATGTATMEASIPGFVGVLSGINRHGLNLSMNVAFGVTRSLRGLPAVFFNRIALDSCTSVGEVVELAKRSPPLGPYHLTLADKEAGASLSFYQNDGNTHTLRAWQPKQALVTTNCNYHPVLGNHMHRRWSQERQSAAEQLHDRKVRDMSPQMLDYNVYAQIVRKALALPLINNQRTTHSIIFHPKRGNLEVGFDNCFAGSEPREVLDLRQYLA
ncbi:MAG: hypothetical protein KDK78_11315 [Chlamydiia bacterium]|nr:hypothetical protein [Chlamydiia bacterium]